MNDLSAACAQGPYQHSGKACLTCSILMWAITTSQVRLACPCIDAEATLVLLSHSCDVIVMCTAASLHCDSRGGYPAQWLTWPAGTLPPNWAIMEQLYTFFAENNSLSGVQGCPVQAWVLCLGNIAACMAQRAGKGGSLPCRYNSG